MPPPVPYQVGDWVRIEIERNEAIALEDSLWNGFWGEVVRIGETGSVEVNVGAKTLRLFPRDLQAIDGISRQFQEVARRVLRLRELELDEIEVQMLNFMQCRFNFTSRQLLHLENIENLCS